MTQVSFDPSATSLTQCWAFQELLEELLTVEPSLALPSVLALPCEQFSASTAAEQLLPRLAAASEVLSVGQPALLGVTSARYQT